MTVARWLCSLLLCAVLAACAPQPGTRIGDKTQPGPGASPPNIVFILTDDLRADSLGVSGNPQAHTPNLDALARRGAYFTKATVHVAQCCPCRAMLVTGLAPHQSGYISIDIQTGRRGQRDGFDDLQTLPGLLAAAGYRTVLTGKWHIAPDPWRCGFGDVRHWMAEGAGEYRDANLCSGASRRSSKVPGFTNEVFADDALAFLGSPRAREGPFLLWLAFTAPHAPLQPTPERINRLFEGKTSRDLMPAGITPESSARWKDDWLPYYRAVAHLDEQVGRVLAALEQKGLARSTVVVFASDSGIMMGRRGIDSKVVPYEDSVRVPLIVCDPRVRAVPPSGAPVSDLDLPPTLLAVAGVQAPRAWPGRDLSRLVRGEHDPAIRDAVCEWVDATSPQWGQWAFHSIFDGRYKLIEWSAKGRPPELYDVDADPHEEHNLAGQPETAAIADDLRARLHGWLERTSAPGTTGP